MSYKGLVIPENLTPQQLTNYRFAVATLAAVPVLLHHNYNSKDLIFKWAKNCVVLADLDDPIKRLFGISVWGHYHPVKFFHELLPFLGLELRGGYFPVIDNKAFFRYWVTERGGAPCVTGPLSLPINKMLFYISQSTPRDQVKIAYFYMDEALKLS